MNVHKSKEKLTSSQGLAYGLPLLSFYFLAGPIAVLQGVYAKHFGLALTTIATILLSARLFDAISDPLIGYYSDRYFSRHRSRKPFVVFGGALFIVASWFLFVPPSNVSSGYFLSWFLIFYLAYTLFEIPHLAWGSELAMDSSEKNKIYGLRSFFVFLGTLFFFSMPLLPYFPSNEITPDTLKWSVVVAGLLMVPMIFICVKNVPDTINIDEPNRINNRGTRSENITSILRFIFTNKPLLTLTSAHVCTGFGSGMWFTLLFIFVDAYLGLGQHFALVYAISFGLSIFTLRIWYQIAKTQGKQATWIIGMLLVTLGLIGTGFLSPEHTSWLELLICMVLIFSGFASFNIMVPSLLSDIVDYGTWKFGKDRAGTYFSLYTFINKSVGALGGALGLAIAGWYGFDPAEVSHNDNIVFGLRFGVAWIPAVIILLSIIFISKIPITTRRHVIVRRRLNRLIVRSAGLTSVGDSGGAKAHIETNLT